MRVLRDRYADNGTTDFDMYQSGTYRVRIDMASPAERSSPGAGFASRYG